MKPRKLSRREAVLLVLLAVAGVVVAARSYLDPARAPVTLSRARSEGPVEPVPRIGLDRLDGDRAEVKVGRRDLFAFGAARPAEDDEYGEDEDDLAPTPPPTVIAPPPGADPAGAATASRLPPLNLKFIGAVGNSKGVQVAVLLTDRNEVLTGQEGEVVANRYRIERIGIESVDLADVGTGQSRRIPLKGN